MTRRPGSRGARRAQRAAHCAGIEGGHPAFHVSYRYDGSSAEALRDVSLEFEAGKSYAVVGGSGSGKSTLLSC